MDENSAMIEQILREVENGNGNGENEDVNEWQTVTYTKRNRKSTKPAPSGSFSSDLHNGGASSGVFSSIEKHSEDRRRQAAEAAAAGSEADVSSAVSNGHKLDDEDDSDGGVAAENGDAVETKKVKPKKPKKPKVTVAEAASKIDAGDLSAFLIDITSSYETQQDIQLMRFADYFGRAFASVSAAQFPWLKIFKESTVSKLVDIPVSHVPDDVYKASVDWLNRRSLDALISFVLWSLDSILADLASHQGATKGSKKVQQQAPSKSLVAIFVVLAMALRRKPDVLISLAPTLREDPKYQGQDKLPIIVWMITQATQGDLAVGLYMWVHFLLPMLSGKSCNPQSRDLILQSVERIISSPKARPILVNGAVKKGDRLVPPAALDSLMRFTFPAPSARVKATERFETIYPTLKDVALAGSPGSKAMKQIAQQTLNYAVKAAGEGVPELSKEAVDVFIWCLTQNPECYKQWDVLYLGNLDASVNVLRKLANEWKEHSVKHSTVDPLRETLKSFRQKNEEGEVDGGASMKEADKYCKLILGRLSKGHGCLKGVFFASIALVAGVAVMSQNVQSLNLDKLSEMFNLS